MTVSTGAAIILLGGACRALAVCVGDVGGDQVARTGARTGIGFGGSSQHQSVQ